MVRFGLHLVILLVLLVGGAAPAGPTAAPLVAATPAGVAAPAAWTAPRFVANAGQFDPAVRYQAHGPAGDLWLTDAAVWLSLPARVADGAPAILDLRLTFDGANPAPVIEPFSPTPGIVSYLHGDDPAGWRTGLPLWSGVVYRDLYPGVDLEIGGSTAWDSGQPFTWRWRTRDGAEPPAALLRIAGGASQLQADGRLQISSALGDLALAPPTLAGAAPIVTSTELTARTAAPSLTFSTTLGGSLNDLAFGVAVDTGGQTYLTGQTISDNFPTTPGARDRFWSFGQEVFVAKLNATGSDLVYATYIGGLGDEAGYGLTIDAAGAAYVTGATTSTNFPITGGALQTRPAGGGDAFVLKLDPSGSAFDWSSYLGGSASDTARAIALDTQGYVHLTGATSSRDFPVAAGAAQTTRRGSEDAFVAKINPAGSGLIFATYLGGSGSSSVAGSGLESGAGLAVDAAGAVYITGTTTSSDFPVTTGVAQAAYRGDGDGFVAKLSPDGTTWLWSTFIGGSKVETVGGIAVDTRGSVYLAGGTASTDFPVTSGATQPGSGGKTDAYVVQINPAGSDWVTSTYLGGSGVEVAAAIGIDQFGGVTVTGFTNSSNFPVSTDALQPARAGGDDAFITRFSPLGAARSYSSFLGGSADDYGRAIALGRDGLTVVAGSTGSLDFPASPGALQVRLRGGSDAFAVRLTLPTSGSSTLQTIVSDGHVGVGAAALGVSWHFAEGFTGAGFDEYLTILNPGGAGSATITYYVERQATPTTRTLPLAASGRTRIAVHAAASSDNPGGLGRLAVGHGTRIETTVPVVAERVMYFERDMLVGSHLGLGATAPAQTWYFAEGYTGAGFQEYLTILNPNATAADVTITYYLDDGSSQVTTLSAPAYGRSTVSVHQAGQGVGSGKAVSAKVTTTHAGGIVVERPMYFGYSLTGLSGQPTASGGHTILGATATATRWSFAEGWTGPGFDEYLTILNPNTQDAAVVITYQLTDPATQQPTTQQKTLTAKAGARTTVTVHDETYGVGRNGGAGWAVSATVESTNGVGLVVERPVYFLYNGSTTGITGGHNVMGATSASATWYLAEGSTATGADTYVTIQNAGAAGSATINYYLDGNPTPQSCTVTLPAGSRTTVIVHDAAATTNPCGLGRLGRDLGLVVTASVPIVVERPIYTRYTTAFAP